jgi:hypothetical protein
MPPQDLTGDVHIGTERDVRHLEQLADRTSSQHRQNEAAQHVAIDVRLLEVSPRHIEFIRKELEPIYDLAAGSSYLVLR